MIIAAVFLLSAALVTTGAYVMSAAARRLDAASDRLETLARERYVDPAPGPVSGPLTTDTMEPEDAAVIKQRNRRGYFA